MKKKLISMLLAGTMVLSLAACGGGGSTGGDAGDGEDAGAAEMGTSDDENTLTVAAWDPNFNIPALEAAAADYKENVNPDFVLDIKEQGGSQDVETAITTAASSGKYETLPDMVLFQDHWIQKYVADYPDAWQDVNDIDINWDDFYTEKLDYSTIDGVHYGVPVDGGTVIMAYRVDLLDQAGYKMDDMKGITWEKFIEVGKAVKEKTGKALLCMNSDGNDLMYMMLQAEGVSQFKDGKPYIVGNDKLKEIVELVVEMVNEEILLLPNSWSDYTDKAIQGDQVAGVMNGNWIIPTIQAVEANSGKWEITTMPTLTGEDGYASNGGSSLYITANCKKTDLAKDFLAYTFGKSTVTYDNALKDGGVVSTYIPAGESEVYNEGVAFFNDTPIYAQISEMGSHVQTIEQSPYHYTCREKLGAAVINIVNGADIDEELKNAEEQLNFEMGN
ncbi:MAG: carbohydrate ABC transporter substrate-binding protein [Dorea sp.]|jgi:lactose/L-arabinose transport system substrate-binding protein|nr:carbohydrate ABC transporter substrate-binding protein [Dorea sp.]MCI9269722.1 carbohydrate ABC transporter substrate-binding protein [Dorea sp.]